MNWRASVVGWSLIAPALFVLLLFFGLPILAAFALSLTDFDIYALADLHNLRFQGLHNYWTILNTPLFWQSLCNTCYFVALGVPATILLSLISALFVNDRTARCKAYFRTTLFAPVVTTLVAVAVIWRYLLNTQYGLINWVLIHLGIPRINWFGDPKWSIPAMVLFAIWKNFGYNMVILLAGRQAIPLELYEAAQMDGASRIQQLRYVTLPMLAPMLLVVSIISLSGYFQLFAEPQMMTGGGPLQSTYSILYFMYEEGFKWWNLGRAATVAFLLFIVIMLSTLLLVRLGRRQEAL